MSDHRISAVVLAGGQSRRFGDGDKALADVADRPMIAHVADRLATVADELVVSCRRDQRADIETALADCPLDPRIAVDPVPDRGPVYGLRTGLRVAAGQFAVVAGCDMPLIEPNLLDYLLDAVHETAAPAVVPRVGGHRQSLCGVYSVRAARDACESAVGRSEPNLRTVLDCLDPLVVSEATVREYADPQTLTSVDTPADIDATGADVRT